MMKKLVFTGSCVALVTPFKEDGSVHYEKLDELIEFHIKNGSDALAICATTGESPTLSHDEHCKLIEHTVQKINKRIPVIASTGSNDTKYAVELSLHAQSVGADALLLVTPYYNKTSQLGLVKHFHYVADRVNIPMIVYNVPSRTGCNIKPETYAELAKHPNINATKEANGDISSIAKTIALCGDELNVYSGDDDQTLPILALGGKGVISVFANVLPKQMHDICLNYSNGAIEESRKEFLYYLDLMQKLFIDVNPIPVKEALNQMGFGVGDCRLPLPNMTDAGKATLLECMRNYKLV